MERGGVETQSDTSSDTPSESRRGDHRDWRSESGAMPLCYTNGVDHVKNRYPHCIVWTPIPLITWLFPFIGHMGICTMQGIIRDFAGPYFVSEDNMGFGNPTKYWQLDPSKVAQGSTKDIWDRAVYDASEEYKGRMHNLFCDNCHSHVAYAMNLMKFEGSTSWNMVKLCFLMMVYSKYVSFVGFLKTWLPFIILALVIILIVVLTHIL